VSLTLRGNVSGSLPEGFTLPTRTSATAFPSSSPGYQGFQHRRNVVEPRHQNGRATLEDDNGFGFAFGNGAMSWFWARQFELWSRPSCPDRRPSRWRPGRGWLPQRQYRCRCRRDGDAGSRIHGGLQTVVGRDGVNRDHVRAAASSSLRTHGVGAYQRDRRHRCTIERQQIGVILPRPSTARRCCAQWLPCSKAGIETGLG